MIHRFLAGALLIILALFFLPTLPAQEHEPPALNPFDTTDSTREDAIPGYLELSNGNVYPGNLYLTRDHRLKILDIKTGRHREIPLKVIRRIDAKILKEWMEKEWRFKENANDEKVYTGRTYPSREYVHVISLNDGHKIEGALAAIIYVQKDSGAAAERFLLHKRDKGETGTPLRSMIYVRAIFLGESALQEGKEKAEKKPG